MRVKYIDRIILSPKLSLLGLGSISDCPMQEVQADADAGLDWAELVLSVPFLL